MNCHRENMTNENTHDLENTYELTFLFDIVLKSAETAKSDDQISMFSMFLSCIAVVYISYAMATVTIKLEPIFLIFLFHHS